jgi:hypothetical protein
MIEPLHLRDLAWALTAITELVLFVYLVRQKMYRTHPAFVFYVFTTIWQSAVLFLVYHELNFRSYASWMIGWGSQVMVTCARWLASFEIARRLLSGYQGIWGLAKRVLIIGSAVVLGYTLLFWHSDWHIMLMSTERGIKLAIASFIVLLLLFARYYRVPVYPLERSLAIGFFLYACFSVINYSLFERWFVTYTDLWNFLDIVFFLASLMIWIYAVRTYPVELAAGNSVFISPEYYGKVSDEVNMRLRMLNDQLAHLLRSEDPHL